MNILFYYLAVTIVGIAMSPFITALIKRFSKEEKIFTKDFIKDVRFDYKTAIIVPVSFLAILYYYGVGGQFVLNSFIAVILIISFFVDIKSQIIPNETNLIGFIIGILYTCYCFMKNFELGIDKVYGLIAGAGIFLLIAGFAYLVFKKIGMGMGDIKLMGVLGLFFGLKNIIQIFIFSFFIGAIISITLLIAKIKKSDDYIPFGPFIVMASFITMFLPATETIKWALVHFVK